MLVVVTIGKIHVGGVRVELMLNSVSLVRQGKLSQAKGIVKIEPEKPVYLVTASEHHLPIMDHIKAPVPLGELELMHTFVVVKSLASPVILGLDFMYENAVVLDFGKTPVSVHPTDTCLSKHWLTQFLM